MKRIWTLCLAICVVLALEARSWTADNGNGTYTNPLFYDEFTDPDMIRVGEDFYMVASCTASQVCLCFIPRTW